jgi:hypothetical protein
VKVRGPIQWFSVDIQQQIKVAFYESVLCWHLLFSFPLVIQSLHLKISNSLPNLAFPQCGILLCLHVQNSGHHVSLYDMQMWLDCTRKLWRKVYVVAIQHSSERLQLSAHGWIFCRYGPIVWWKLEPKCAVCCITFTQQLSFEFWLYWAKNAFSESSWVDFSYVGWLRTGSLEPMFWTGSLELMLCIWWTMFWKLCFVGGHNIS